MGFEELMDIDPYSLTENEKEKILTGSAAHDPI